MRAYEQKICNSLIRLFWLVSLPKCPPQNKMQQKINKVQTMASGSTSERRD